MSKYNMSSNNIKSDGKSEYLKKLFKYFLQAGIISYLLYKIYEIGVDQVITNMPVDPLFYLIILCIYFSLPLSEILIYRVKWAFDIKKTFIIFIKKKVINTDVFGYAGEVYFVYWVKNNLKIPVGDAFTFIKDNNVLSSISSTAVSLILLFFF